MAGIFCDMIFFRIKNRSLELLFARKWFSVKKNGYPSEWSFFFFLNIESSRKKQNIRMICFEISLSDGQDSNLSWQEFLPDIIFTSPVYGYPPQMDDNYN